jgi:hypothetical protein
VKINAIRDWEMLVDGSTSPDVIWFTGLRLLWRNISRKETQLVNAETADPAGTRG